MERRTPSGRKVRRPEGYSAFIPDPLPPRIEWTPELVTALSTADRQIGRLAGEGRQLPNPQLLIHPFVRREAVLSSRIEGTQATLGELLAAEAGATVERSPDDLREVGNYVTALEYGLTRLEKLPLSLRLTRELHRKLMTGVRGDRATPGEFRRTQNWVGPPGATPATASYIPPPPEKLMACLGPWETFLHDRVLPPLVHIALAHYQFEAIHPFLDGNGRVGRLLVTLALVERGVLPAPLLYLSAYFEATRTEYFARLRGIQEDAAWEAWLHYFLEGVARQSEDALRRAEQVNSLLTEWRRRLADAPSPAASQFLDLLAENPYWTVRRAASRLKIAFTTAQRALERLRTASILTQVGEARRDRVYCATDLLKVLEAPTAPVARGKRR